MKCRSATCCSDVLQCALPGNTSTGRCGRAGRFRTAQCRLRSERRHLHGVKGRTGLRRPVVRSLRRRRVTEDGEGDIYTLPCMCPPLMLRTAPPRRSQSAIGVGGVAPGCYSEEPDHANNYDYRPRYREASFSGSWRRSRKATQVGRRNRHMGRRPSFGVKHVPFFDRRGKLPCEAAMPREAHFDLSSCDSVDPLRPATSVLH
jgi:hypothetical protein